MTLTVQNRQRAIPLDLPALRDFAKRALEAVLKTEAQAGDILPSIEEIGVVVVSDRRIAQMHLDFMNLPGPTDVLTFEHGEIIISADTAARYAAEYGQTAQEEVALYVLHGLLHLRGYDDLESSAARKMRRVQARLFARLNKTGRSP